MAVKSHEELEVWQKAMDLVVLVYQSTRMFPKDELYGLTSQLRKAAVSVPSNIAEGQGRKSKKDFLHHLSIARGSLMEVKTQLDIARRLGYFPETCYEPVIAMTNTVGRLLNGLIRALETKA